MNSKKNLWNITLSGNPLTCDSYYWDLRENAITISDLSQLNCINNNNLISMKSSNLSLIAMEQKIQTDPNQNDSIYISTSTKINVKQNSICDIPLEKIYQVWNQYCSQIHLNSSIENKIF